MDPHLHRARADPVDEREGLFAGQCGRGGFFGRLKQEFFHKRSFRGVTIDEFTAMLDDTWSGTATSASRPNTA